MEKKKKLFVASKRRSVTNFAYGFTFSLFFWRANGNGNGSGNGSGNGDGDGAASGVITFESERIKNESNRIEKL